MNNDYMNGGKMNYDEANYSRSNSCQIHYDKMNLFSESFNMNYVLKAMEKNFDERKHLLCDVNRDILSSQRKKQGLNKYEQNLIEKQTQILIHGRGNYKKLNNINYVKYFLPYCVQPKTNNTNMCLSKNINQKNSKKQNILRELHIKKKVTEYKIDHFVKKYTGKFKRKNILHTQISKLYSEKYAVEICIKNRTNNKICFDVVIGDIVFFDHKPNLLLENVTLVNNEKQKNVPWIFIQSDSIFFLKKKKP
ncbi:conserved Plasmodium protein, unknown function [Plasmodium ovale]|uniref:Uncharacterized protein n=1 Tax=Plasmodium ovale TaxID=36330 RepID=A0A1D3U7W8_PLAOA|nr:conserved Plasmodium protein, unknown function [Plasmodium ovale]